MPMHYPPLANGTYRYGDAPQPLPSPTPGPEPGPTSGPTPGRSSGLTSGSAPLAPALPYGPTPQAGPPPEAPPEQPRSKGSLAAAAIIGGLALVVVALVGIYFFGPAADRGASFDTLRGPLPQGEPAPLDLPSTGEFTADGTFTVVASPGEPVSGDDTGCEMPGSLSDIGAGTTLTLLEADTGRTVRSMLAYDGGDLTSCTFTFSFADVTPGGTLYMVELPGRGQLVYTEDELRTGIDISLGR